MTLTHQLEKTVDLREEGAKGAQRRVKQGSATRGSVRAGAGVGGKEGRMLSDRGWQSRSVQGNRLGNKRYMCDGADRSDHAEINWLHAFLSS